MGIVFLEIEFLNSEHEPRAIGRKVERAGTLHGPKVFGGDGALRGCGIGGAEKRSCDDEQNDSRAEGIESHRATIRARIPRASDLR